MPTKNTTIGSHLIGDERSVRILLHKNLEHPGYSMIEAADVHRGAVIYKQDIDQIDVLLLALTMPYITEYDMLSEIQT